MGFAPSPIGTTEGYVKVAVVTYPLAQFKENLETEPGAFTPIEVMTIPTAARLVKHAAEVPHALSAVRRRGASVERVQVLRDAHDALPLVEAKAHRPSRELVVERPSWTVAKNCAACRR